MSARLQVVALRPTKLYARPTRDGLWHPVNPKGHVGWPVEVNLTRCDGKVTVHLFYHGREESYEIASCGEGTRWMRYVAPKVIK